MPCTCGCPSWFLCCCCKTTVTKMEKSTVADGQAASAAGGDIKADAKAVDAKAVSKVSVFNVDKFLKQSTLLSALQAILKEPKTQRGDAKDVSTRVANREAIYRKFLAEFKIDVIEYADLRQVLQDLQNIMKFDIDCTDDLPVIANKISIPACHAPYILYLLVGEKLEEIARDKGYQINWSLTSEQLAKGIVAVLGVNYVNRSLGATDLVASVQQSSPRKTIPLPPNGPKQNNEVWKIWECIEQVLAMPDLQLKAIYEDFRGQMQKMFFLNMATPDQQSRTLRA